MQCVEKSGVLKEEGPRGKESRYGILLSRFETPQNKHYIMSPTPTTHYKMMIP